ncbi:MAG TPA: helix-turn-helix domain-containing protein [Methanocella sp.]|nr:helix-turn-helix domain-containing protein [Methanocella sp.]
MHHDTNRICLCNLEGTINIISKKWAIIVISTIGNHGTMRFSELMTDMNSITSKTLADLLKVLEREGLISRESFAEIPPRVEYSLTADGQQLREALIPLLNWADRRDTRRNKPRAPRSPGTVCRGEKLTRKKRS